MALCLGYPANAEYLRCLVADRSSADSVDIIVAPIIDFRDAVLRQKPVFLDTLLKKSRESSQGFDKVLIPLRYT